MKIEQEVWAAVRIRRGKQFIDVTTIADEEVQAEYAAKRNDHCDAVNRIKVLPVVRIAKFRMVEVEE